ncbi:GNAT family N-acetyltransferase [Acuticoccus mangrovi]|uniref:GNAT family N-acetyltransferase n=1 Tax=Acuticoccus mangrovi TaxID=2796142 RepID=A0A934IMM6_9HYPH|nr:GNAT family N-acetyltransferase [Acuticoccus mangrovi]MBJ3775415.1 GNAT family N-acetyltransferase [Acuticoccus mangrovi]
MSPTPVKATVRAARPDDVPALTLVNNCPGVRRGTLRLPFTSEEEVRRRMLEPGPNTHLVVGDVDGTAVGWAALFRRVGRQAHVAGLAIAVHDDHQGRGVGRAMMAGLLDLADNWLGLVRIELDVNTDNGPAIALYESLGFEREGLKRAETLRDGVFIDVILMARIRPAPLHRPADAA